MSTSQLKGRIFLKNNLFIRFLLYTLKSCFDQLSRYFRQLHLNCFYPLLDVNILDQKQEEEKKMDQNFFFFFLQRNPCITCQFLMFLLRVVSS